MITDNDPLRELLSAYLDRDAEARSKGVTLESLYNVTSRLTSEFTKHEKECEERWRQNSKDHDGTKKRVTILETSGVIAEASASAARAIEAAVSTISKKHIEQEEITGSFAIGPFAEKVKSSAIEAYLNPNDDPDEKIRRIVAEEEQVREFSRLKNVETKSLQARQNLKTDLRNTILSILAGVLIAIGIAGTLGSCHWIATLHH